MRKTAIPWYPHSCCISFSACGEQFCCWTRARGYRYCCKAGQGSGLVAFSTTRNRFKTHPESSAGTRARIGSSQRSEKMLKSLRRTDADRSAWASAAARRGGYAAEAAVARDPSITTCLRPVAEQNPCLPRHRLWRGQPRGPKSSSSQHPKASLVAFLCTKPNWHW